MYYKGKYKPHNPKKYLGDSTNIVYRSSWEKKFMIYCDTNPQILEWGSEEFFIPYRSPLDRRIHRYFPDFFIKYKDKDGNIQKSVIEIKPYNQCIPPTQPKRKTKAYMNKVKTFVINEAKWTAAKEFCENQGLKFQILTEKELFK